MQRRPILSAVLLIGVAAALPSCEGDDLEGLRPVLSVTVQPPTGVAPTQVDGHAVLEFGDVAIGSRVDLPDNVTALNTGRLPLTLQPASPTAPFSADLKAVATVAPQGHINLGFAFSPTTLGPVQQSVVLNSNGGSVTIVLQGNGVPVPPAACRITAAPAALDFANVLPGQTKALKVHVTNDGTAVCTVTALQLAAGTSPAFSITSGTTPPPPLTANDGFFIEVTFAPTAAAPTFTGTLRITAESPETIVNVPLSGTSIVPSCAVTVSPMSIDFMSVMSGQKKTGLVTITNTSEGSCVISDVQIAAGSSTAFSLAALQPTSGTLATMNATFLIGVVFAPPTPSGTFTGTLTFEVGSPGVTTSIPLSGTSPAPCANPNPNGSCVKATAPIYANTSSSLYSFDTTTNTTTFIADFYDTAGDSFEMDDIAIDNTGFLIGVSSSVLYSIDPTTAECTRLVAVSGNPNGLTIEPGSNNIVVAGSEVDILDRTTFASTTLVPSGGYSTSGDIVALPNGLLYWSVLGTGSGNVLVTIDPTTAAVTEIGNMGVAEVYGLAYASNALYGFSDKGLYLIINPSTASATQGSAPGGWYGATSNPVTW